MVYLSGWEIFNQTIVVLIMCVFKINKRNQYTWNINSHVLHISNSHFINFLFCILYNIIKPSHLIGGKVCAFVLCYKTSGYSTKEEGGSAMVSLSNIVWRTYTIPLYRFTVVYLNLLHNCLTANLTYLK